VTTEDVMDGVITLMSILAALWLLLNAGQLFA